MRSPDEPRTGEPASAVRRIVRRLSRTVPVEGVPFLRGQVIGLACVLLATLLRLGLDPVLTGSPYITFFPAILIAGIWGGTRAGVTALALSWAITSYLWLEPAGRPSFDRNAAWSAASFALFGGVLLVIEATLSDLVLALRRSEEHARMLAGEMEHRVENLSATATALARQTARSAATTEQHVELFEARMAALGHARKLALAAPGGATGLRGLIEGVLAPFEATRFDLTGPDAQVPAALATMLALALHELATNALKYGALAQPGGRVALLWSRRDGRIEIEWAESGGPVVAEPQRTGFGTRMIRSSLASHGAASELCFLPGGLRCRIGFAEAEAEPDRADADPCHEEAASSTTRLLPANGPTR